MLALNSPPLLFEWDPRPGNETTHIQAGTSHLRSLELLHRHAQKLAPYVILDPSKHTTKIMANGNFFFLLIKKEATFHYSREPLPGMKN